MPPKTRPNSEPGRFARLFSSPRQQRQLLVLSVLIFIVGVIAAMATFMRGTGNAFVGTKSTIPVKLYHKPKTVKPSPAAYAVAREFIKTAVERQNLDVSYTIVHPDLKGRMTRKEWDTGTIPVIGYPAENAESAAFQVDYSYATEMLLEVDLVAKPGSQVRPHLLFFLGLKRDHNKPTGRWLVNYWQPHWKPPVPAAAN